MVGFEEEEVLLVIFVVVVWEGESGRVGGGLLVDVERRRGGEGVGGIDSVSEISSTGGGRALFGLDFMGDVVVGSFRGRPRFISEDASGLVAVVVISTVAVASAFGRLPFLIGELCLESSGMMVSVAGGCGIFEFGGRFWRGTRFLLSQHFSMSAIISSLFLIALNP